MNQLMTLAEKAIWTYVQALIVAILSSGQTDINLTTALLVATLPAGLTVVANGMPVVLENVSFGVQLAYRVVRSFTASFLGFLLAASVFTLQAGALRSAAMAGLVSVLVIVKGLIAQRIGDLDSPATLPASVTT